MTAQAGRGQEEGLKCITAAAAMALRAPCNGIQIQDDKQTPAPWTCNHGNVYYPAYAGRQADRPLPSGREQGGPLCHFAGGRGVVT